MPSSRTCSIAALLALSLAACSGSAPPRTNAAGSRSPVARARADSARYPYTAADIRFMSGMIGHHAQAIVMSGMAPTHGASATVRTLAERIISSQQDEIVIMQRWLRDRSQPVPDPTAHSMAGMDMSTHAGMHTMPASGASTMMPGMMMPGMMMPGMLTDEQLKQLDAAQGPAFDELFLTFMMQHHRGALTMVQELLATDGAAQDETVFKFASDVHVDQTTEIARMERMLFMLKLEKKSPGSLSPIPE